MSQKSDTYLDQLERLSARFPGREAISINEAAEALGVDRRTLTSNKTFPAKRLGQRGAYIVPLVAFARWLV